MDISKTGTRRLDTFVRVAVIHAVAVTFGEYEPRCASTIRFRTSGTGRCRTQHDKVMTKDDTHLRGEWHPRCSVRCEIITL